ncbi:MBL fold metallo-hydrolase [Propionibacteriaceae bacterium Y1685]|uniref:MBL fold metallo-hydrolase n=1 Tax=Microlunatus sp. Y1700 TaxID=3418487 RepID=UPI003B784E6A
MHPEGPRSEQSASPTPTTEPTLGEWREIRPRVWIAQAEPAAVTIGVVAGETGALVVDCGSTPSQGADIRAAAEELAGVPVIAAVVTHAHWDHWFGLSAFDDVITIGHESLLEALDSDESLGEQAAGLGFTADELVAPNAPLTVVRALDVGGRRVELFHPGPGHTEGDLVVHVPDAEVLFVGDLVEQAGPPWYGTDSRPHDWATTLDSVIGMLGEHTLAVVGHGDPVDRDFCLQTRAATAAVSGEIRALVERGVPVDQAYAEGHWPWPEANIAAGIERGYDELGGPRPPKPPMITLPMA